MAVNHEPAGLRCRVGPGVVDEERVKEHYRSRWHQHVNASIRIHRPRENFEPDIDWFVLDVFLVRSRPDVQRTVVGRARVETNGG